MERIMKSIVVKARRTSGILEGFSIVVACVGLLIAIADAWESTHHTICNGACHVFADPEWQIRAIFTFFWVFMVVLGFVAILLAIAYGLDFLRGSYELQVTSVASMAPSNSRIPSAPRQPTAQSPLQTPEVVDTLEEKVEPTGDGPMRCPRCKVVVTLENPSMDEIYWYCPSCSQGTNKKTWLAGIQSPPSPRP